MFFTAAYRFRNRTKKKIEVNAFHATSHAYGTMNAIKVKYEIYSDTC